VNVRREDCKNGLRSGFKGQIEWVPYIVGNHIDMSAGICNSYRWFHRHQIIVCKPASQHKDESTIAREVEWKERTS
jgi:hypothetical protein